MRGREQSNAHARVGTQLQCLGIFFRVYRLKNIQE